MATQSMECNVCLHALDNSAEDPSTFLTCFHVFHSYCIGNVAKVAKDQGDSFECPTCRTKQPDHLATECIASMTALEIDGGVEMQLEALCESEEVPVAVAPNDEFEADEEDKDAEDESGPGTQ